MMCRLQKQQNQPSFWNPKARCLVVKPCRFKADKKGHIKALQLKGSQTQIMRRVLPLPHHSAGG